MSLWDPIPSRSPESPYRFDVFPLAWAQLQAVLDVTLAEGLLWRYKLGRTGGLRTKGGVCDQWPVVETKITKISKII